MSKPETWGKAEGDELRLGSGRVGTLPMSALDGDSPVATEFHRLYSRLTRMDVQKRLSVILVTSARRGEGKTTTSAFLAQSAAAHSDKKVVVVDCDLRRPRLHEVFGVNQRVGMSDLLGSLVPLGSVIKSTELPNLKLITSGRMIGVPTALFESSTFKAAVAELRANFDLVVIDSAPVLPVADAFFISTTCDGVLLVVMAGKTPVEVVARAGELLSEGGANLLGAVINNVEEVLPYYYDYHYYGYKEGEEGGESRQGRRVKKT
ncbi:MAG: CpsD/CapB family tyrosine-protein kinase [Candidatus Eisenbacteria bacterium]|nr:CpsD/CapB family tyrosine-protein kinase [Candidatus Eisenbacteria bacterium]